LVYVSAKFQIYSHLQDLTKLNIFNDKKDEVGFALDMALKSLGRISGRLHFLAQNQVTAQAVKAIYSQEDY
jgi:hypothetical protein